MKFLFYFSFLFLVSCTSSHNVISYKDSRVINLDERKENVLLFSDIFKSAKTIILETNKDYLIGNIASIQVYDNHIFVCDVLVANSLYVFDLDGRFVRKIGQMGRGPGEYIKIIDFTLDIDNKIIYLLDNTKWIHSYAFDGTHIKKIEIDVPKINTKSIQYYKGYIYADVIDYSAADDEYMLLRVDVKNGKVLSHYFPSSLNKGWNELRINQAFWGRLNDHPLYTQIFMNEIIKIDEQPKVQFLLQSDRLTTEKDIENIRGKNMYETMKNYFKLNETHKIYDVCNLFENGNHFYFEYNQGKNIHSILYNKQSNTTQSINLTKNDLVFHNVPGDNKHRILFYDQYGVFDVPEYDWLFGKIQENVNKNYFNPNLDKLEHLKQLSPDANPVIFFYEFK